MHAHALLSLSIFLGFLQSSTGSISLISVSFNAALVRLVYVLD